jgi:predicted GTPase
VLVGALLERYVLEVALLERTEVDRALRVRAWLGEAQLERSLLEEALLERTEVGRALLRRVPVLVYAEAWCLVLVGRL